MTRPPGPGGSPVKQLLAVRRGQTSYFTNLARDYGDVSYVRLGPERVYLVAHPDDVRDVLVTKARHFRKGRGIERTKWLLGEGLLTSEGEFHLRQRRLAQPAFHRERMSAYADQIVACAAALEAGWRDGAEVSMAAEMQALTLDAVARTLFSASVSGEAAEVGAAVGTALSMFNRMLLPGAQLLARLPLPSSRRMRAARDRLDETVYRIIATRRASPEDRGDLLSMLLLAQDEEAAPGEQSSMSDQQVRDEVMTLFLAGHETTANALAWSWWLLSQHPAVAEKLRASLDEVLGGRLPAYADLPRLGAAERVLAESMRLYPPAWIVGRRAVSDVSIGDWTVPAGTLVLVSQWVTHRDPRWWPAPEVFDPDRWLDTPDERPKFAYFPFGGGNRLCIGESFAWMEGTLLLAALASRWEASYTSAEPPVPKPAITLRPGGGVPMTLRRR